MTLAEAWKEIKIMKGAQNFAPRLVYSILDDLGVFKGSSERMRLVVRDALKHGLWGVILNSSKDFDKIKSALNYDGFADNVISQLEDSISFYVGIPNREMPFKSHDCYNEEKVEQFDKPLVKETLSSASCHLNNKTVPFCFVGIPIGESITTFRSNLPAKGFTLEHPQNTEGEFCYAFYGNLAGFSTSAAVYYSDISKIVYKIDIEIIESAGMWDKYDKAKECINMYTSKYGKPLKQSHKHFSGLSCLKLVYKVNNDQVIEIYLEPDKRIKNIVYIDKKLYDLVKPEIDALIMTKKNKINAERQAKRLRDMQDI